MSHFIIDDAAREKAAALIAHAEAHPYMADDPSARPPGEDPCLVAVFDSFRVVFSFTEREGVRFRHLTISLVNRRKGMYPDPIMAFAIADLLGFTGWTEQEGHRVPPGWGIRPIEHDNCVSIIQAIGSTVPKSAQQ